MNWFELIRGRRFWEVIFFTDPWTHASPIQVASILAKKSPRLECLVYDPSVRSGPRCSTTPGPDQTPGRVGNMETGHSNRQNVRIRTVTPATFRKAFSPFFNDSILTWGFVRIQLLISLTSSCLVMSSWNKGSIWRMGCWTLWRRARAAECIANFWAAT